MRTVFITGANRGLGLELARQYSADGWRVLATSRGEAPELAALAGNVRLLRLDVGDFAAIENLARELHEESIDVLINNAGYLGRVSSFGEGGAEYQQFGRMDYPDWEHTLRINVLAPMKMAECFVEQVARSTERKIVTLTSMVGSMDLNTTGGLYAYRSSKAAVNAVMKSMSIDLGRQGILAVALHPGWVRTRMGGDGAHIDAPTSVSGMRRVIASLKAEDLGHVYAYDGARLPY